MQIHELNNFTGTLGSGAYLAVDDGNDTGKLSTQQLLSATEARIDNIIAGPAPSAEEIVDARLGADGVTYPSLGDAIRDQVSDLKAEINEILIKGVNLFDPEKATQGAWINNTTGEVTSDTDSYWISDFLPNDHSYIGTLGIIRVWYYNDDKSYRSTDTANLNGQVFNAINAGYVRVGFMTAQLDTVTIVKGESIPSASPYIPPHINPDFLSELNNVVFNDDVVENYEYKFGEMQQNGDLTDYTAGIRFANYERMGKGTTITVGNGLYYNVGLFDYDSEQKTYELKKYFKSENGATYTVPYDSLVMVSIWKPDSSAFSDLSSAEHIDISLKTNLLLRVESLEDYEASQKPIIYDKSGSTYFNPIVCDYYSGKQLSYDNATFNKTTNYTTMINAFDALMSAHSDYISKEDLGVCSDEVNHIYAYTLKALSTQNQGKKKPTILIVAGQHGFEKASIYGLYYLVKDLCEKWDESGILDALKNHCIIKMIAVANPYGFNNNSYYNANGVNLNKNYDTSRFPIDETGGASPFSEPETQIIRDFVQANLDAVLLMDVHTNGSDKAAHWYDVNWIDFPQFEDVFRVQFVNRARAHIENIYAHFNKEYNLNLTELCGRVTNPEWGYPKGYPSLDNWTNDNGIVGHTFEGSGGFPTDSSSYTANVLKYNSELLGNWLGYVYALFA